MTADELGRILRGMYDDAPEGEKVANIHLFGVKYASEMKAAAVNPGEVVRASGIKASYGVEVNKGVKLSRYVVPKDPA